jgi:hypothetical protein
LFEVNSLFFYDVQECYLQKMDLSGNICEVREFVICGLLNMDADAVIYPKEYVTEAAQNNLSGLWFSKVYGGRGLQ